MAGEVAALPVCELLVNGRNIPEWVEILECVVDESIYLPSACTVRFFVDASMEDGLSIVDSNLLLEGSALELKMGFYDHPLGIDNKTTVFKGEIVATELDLNAMGPSTYTIRALDKSHRMHIGVNQKIFLNVKDSDVISQVLSVHNFSHDVDATTGVKEWIVQNNESDWDFVKHLAWRNGMRLYMDRDQKLNVKKFAHTSGSCTLAFLEDILAFRPRTAASTQVSSVELRSWDMQNKKVISVSSSSKPAVPSPAADLAGAKSAAKFEGKPMMICAFPSHDTGSARATADALYETISAEYLKADVLCQGNPILAPGVKAEIKGVGTRFSGTYTITTATHIYGPKGGYTTQIGIDGGFGAGVDALFGSGGSGAGSGTSTVSGSVNSSLTSANLQVCVGEVTRLNDPQNQGRIMVKLPFLAEDSNTYWVRVATPMAGPSRGIMFLPEVGDEVLIAFEHGDIHRPYMIGALWNGKDAPPEGNDKVAPQGVDHRWIKTRIGHTVLFDDSDDKKQILITSSGKHTWTLDDANRKIDVKTTNGLQMTMDDGATTIEIKDPKGNSIKIDGSSNQITINSLGNITLKAAENIDMQAQMNFTIQGLAVSATANSTMALKANAAASFQSTGELTIQGAMVMIN